MAEATVADVREVTIEPDGLLGLLGVPEHATGIVIFAHGTGSGRLSPRNNTVAAALRQAGLATLLLDLLTQREESDRANVFDIELLAARLTVATHWVSRQRETSELRRGYFGASTGAAAALYAAARPDARIAAVVSRGGRPDLALAVLPLVRAPTLLLVGSLDGPVIAMNRRAYNALEGERRLIIVEGAGHLFEEPGTMEQVIGHATAWFVRYLGGPARKQ
jgi:alpha-beta hydrolase superfamily lysophospholipase